MTESLNYDVTMSKRAFQKGMLTALAIAFVPLGIVWTGLFISGYHASDIDTGLRSILILAWLSYIVMADRVANFRLWMRLPLLRSINVGEVITIIASSALLSTMRLNPGMARAELATTWLKSFEIILLCFGALYILFKSYNAVRHRAVQRRKLARLAKEEAKNNAALLNSALKTHLQR